MRKLLIRLLLTFLSLLPIGVICMAQTGTVTFTGTDYGNMGTILHDGSSSNDIIGIQLNIFGAMSPVTATSRTNTGSFVFLNSVGVGNICVPIDVSSGSYTVIDNNLPRIVVIMSNDGSEFNFKSIYIGDYIGSNSPIKFEGFRNGVSTGSVILTINTSTYDETFTSTSLTPSIFQNVDEVRISNQNEGDMVWGIYAGFNNIEIAPAVTPTVVPTVSTQAVSSISTTTATGNGNITATGGADITERGIYYSTTNGFADGTGTKVSTTGIWSTTGAFTQAITGLSAGTTYYVKAFATNSVGTSYGAQMSFTTTATATSWTKVIPSAGSLLYCVQYGNNAFITIDYNTGNIYKSTDNAQSWTLKKTGAGTPGYLAYANSMFIATDNNMREYEYYSTDDGETWTEKQIGSGLNYSMGGITYGSSGFAAVSNNSSYANIFKSSDGISWTQVFHQIDPDGISGLALANIGYGNGTYVAVGSSGRVFTSTDASSWTSRTTPTTQYLMGVAYGNGIFVAVAGNGAVIKSSDNGLTWGSSVTYTASAGLNNIAFANGYFYAVGYGGLIIKSSDGVTWTTETSGVATDLWGITYGNGNIVVSGDAGVILIQTSTPTTVAPTITTQAVSSISTTTATGNGNVTATGGANITERGIYYSTTNGFADGTGTKVSTTGTWNTTGTFTQAITGLTANTTYYVKAFATNSVGTSYGAQESFTTSGIAPTVTTQAVGSISTTTATGNGNITDLGVPNPTQHGVVWSTSPNPTISDNKTTQGAASATGAFTSSMTGLSPNTKYYVRAYATNTAGTSYGLDESFTTDALTLGVSSSSESFIKNGESKDVSVTSNTTWTASSNEPWLTVSPSTATTGDATLTLTAAANAGSTSRTATVTISASGVSSQTISVTQSGKTLLTINDPLIINKVYDGTQTATVTAGTLTNYVGTGITVSATANYDNKNVGTGKTITVSYTISGADAGDYSAPVDYVVTHGVITAKPITIVSAVAQNKVYNALTDATVTGATLSGVETGDDVSLSLGTASFADKKVADAKAVTVTGSTLTGADKDNYSLTEVSGLIANITAKPITIVSAVAQNKVYNASTDATVTGAVLSGVETGDDVSLTLGTASFATKTVDNAKAVTVNGSALTGADKDNYSLTEVSGLTANITAKPITIVSAVAQNKVYDASTDATVTGAMLSGVETGDDVSLSLGTASFADKKVADAKAVTVTGSSLTGADKDNYSLTEVSGLTANITAKPITIVSAVAQNKVYDASTDATVTGAVLSGVETGDDVSLNLGTASFATKTVDNAKAVTVTGSTLTGADKDNYSLTEVSGLTADITAKPITIISAIAQNKVYNALTDATVTGAVLSGVETGDVVDLTLGTASFADKKVADAKAVTVTGSALTGADKDNYSLTEVSGLTADITAKPITIITAVAQNKVYNALTDATVTGAMLSGVETGDVVDLTLGTASFADKKVADAKAVTVTGSTLTGADKDNYSLTEVSGLTANITAKPITIVSAVAQNKVYDALTDATVNGAVLSGVETGDDVSLTLGTASFATKTVDNAKAVTVTGSTLTGADKDNYSLTEVSGLTANITAKPITIVSAVAQNKVYDASTDATVTGAVLSGVETGDDVSLSLGTASFADKKVADAKAVTVTGSALTGADKDNYSLTEVSGLTANITAKPITIVSAVVQNKVYNALTDATVNGATLSGVETGDDVSLSLGTASFATKTVDNAKAVTVTGSTLTGADKDNYSLTEVSGLTADITAKPITIVSAVVQNKVYNALTDATVTGAVLSGVETGDDVSLTLGTASFATKTVDNAKAVTVTGSTLTGADKDNYSLTEVSGLTANITAKPITIVSAVAQNKVYNALTDATVTGAVLSGVETGDDVSLSLGTASFADKKVADAKAVTVTGSSLTGADKDNYSLTEVSGLTADITAKQLVIANPTLTTSKIYDGNTTAGIVIGALSNKESGDIVTVNASTNYNDANVGSEKTITVAYSISGTDAANYIAPGNYLETNGSIQAKQLTISSPIITTIKMYDGNSIAAATSGTLSGVLNSDIVTAFISANYNDATVATNKTITVNYTIDGSSASNYLAPITSTISGAKILAEMNLTDNKIDVPAMGGCQGDQLFIAYNIQSGTPTEYQITFSQNALDAGFSNIAYTALATSVGQDTIFTAIPSNMKEGTYTAYLKFRNEIGFESTAFAFDFTINLPKTHIVTKYNNVVLCDNSANNFSAYQWYKNGVAINGATKQFYQDKNGLVGDYYVEVKTKTGESLHTCSQVLNLPVTAKTAVEVYPNPAKSSAAFTVRITNVPETDLADAEMFIFNTAGAQVYTTDDVQILNSVQLPVGDYVGVVYTKDGNKYSFKVSVGY